MVKLLGGGTSLPQLISDMNTNLLEIQGEQITKTFKQANGNAIVQGKLPYEGGYGTLYYDSDGIPNIVQGILPDGTMGAVYAKPGVNVLDLF